MKRTVSIPVNLPSERFLPLMAECAEIFNQMMFIQMPGQIDERA